MIGRGIFSQARHKSVGKTCNLIQYSEKKKKGTTAVASGHHFQIEVEAL